MPAKAGNGPRGPFTKQEIEFVKTAYPGLGAADIARRLGRSRSGVCNLIRRMREEGELAPRVSTEASMEASTEPAPEPAHGAAPEPGRLGELRWLAGTLRKAILAADAPRDVARLSEEYRATLAEIERLEGDGEGGASIAELLATVSISVPQGP